FNGEIYNYIELREEVIAKGYKLKSKTDTEVLLALYKEYGVDLLSKLDGMFAFAIWDQEKEQLFCARDRFGEKPFYYSELNDEFVFGSEMKALWAYGIPKSLDDNRLHDFVMNGNVEIKSDFGRSYYHGISKLDAAHYLIISKDGNVRKEKYWDLDSIRVNDNISFEEALIEYRKLFQESVRLRLRADVPVGSSLSGGLDSSSIVCVIDQLKKDSQIQKVFSARFKDFKKDEGEYINKVLTQKAGIRAFDVYPVEDDLVSIVKKVAYHQEEPFVSSSIIAQWKVMELAKNNNVTVLLDGQGADEFLGGYLKEYKVYLNQLYYQDSEKYEFEYEAYNKLLGSEYPIQRVESTESLRMKLGKLKRNILGQEIEYPLFKDSLSSMLQDQGLKELLRYADRNSMAHSIEVRLPFLSHKLVEFAFSLPDRFLLNQGWTKYIQRKAMDGIVPNDICWRKDKVGYEPPQDRWMNNKEVQEIVNDQRKLFRIGEKELTEGGSTNNMTWRLFMAAFTS
ncbi:MAG: asparagine synthase (glutamine-hydrolyzing), partial [Planctomycetes bacterium]|nr:asparagine synthase (glutamine-hydrolyzing) [Planctomycetota bacterium]